MSDKICRILHVAPFNTVGVPMAFVRAERELGFESRLVTLYRNRRGLEEDICLDLPFLDFAGTRWAKKIFSNPARLRVTNRRPKLKKIPPVWSPHSIFEAALVRSREWLWTPRIRAMMRELDFWNFDLYQFDGGLEFYRDGRIVRELKKRGKKIVVGYTGSDLRTRGVIKPVDDAADVRVTVEYDHLNLHPDIQHIFFPFDVRPFRVQPVREKREGELVIGHAPSLRAAKGSDIIIDVVNRLVAEIGGRLLLIEGMSLQDALKAKAECDIFIDQLGDLGYGINSLESLAMGIPTCTCLVEGFAQQYPDHPFIEVMAENLFEKLRELSLNFELRRKFAERSREWVERVHDGREGVMVILDLLNERTK
jgi:glycosyltransferase involved in cell wall biosynthesis